MVTAVLHAGARLLAEAPGTSMAAIAAAAGVDRTTVHRHFAHREALLSAVFQAKLDSTERVLDEARLTEAPVPVALHRYLEGIIPVSREWPLETRRMMQKGPHARARRQEQGARLDAFLQRAIEEGHLRADTDPAWARAVLDRLVDSAAHHFPDLSPPRAADLIARTLLQGLAGP
jgi:AcrR family transcriptional regulator